MSDIVTRARDLAELKLSESLPRRWRHVAATGRAAEHVAVLVEVDRAELVAAAWLHDIGYAPDLVVTGFHPLDGARFLVAEGLPARVCHLVAHHSCAVREAELRGLSEELAEFTDEATPGRDALWYCDMTTGPDGDRLSVDRRLAEITRRYGPDHVVTRFIVSARDELVGAVERTQARLLAAGVDQPM